VRYEREREHDKIWMCTIFQDLAKKTNFKEKWV
jgi:hypothetical protein